MALGLNAPLCHHNDCYQKGGCGKEKKYSQGAGIMQKVPTYSLVGKFNNFASENQCQPVKATHSEILLCNVGNERRASVGAAWNFKRVGRDKRPAKK